MTTSSIAFLVSIGASLSSMVVYAGIGRRRDSDTDSKGARLFGGAGDFVLHWFMWAIAPLVGASLRLRLTPDFFNYAGLLLGSVGGILVALGRVEWGGWAIALCGIADVLDGRIARMTGVASAYGDFIDSTFDRFVEVFVFLGFALYLRDRPLGSFLAAAAMGGSLLVSYARARGEVLGVLCAAGFMQRGERLVLLCLACFLDPLVTGQWGGREGSLVVWTLAFIAVTTLVTATQRTVWISKRLR